MQQYRNVTQFVLLALVQTQPNVTAALPVIISVGTPAVLHAWLVMVQLLAHSYAFFVTLSVLFVLKTQPTAAVVLLREPM